MLRVSRVAAKLDLKKATAELDHTRKILGGAIGHVLMMSPKGQGSLHQSTKR